MDFNMKERNSISVDAYCHKQADAGLRKRMVNWIKETGALITVDGKKHIDIPKFDVSILKALDEERDRIQTEFDFRSASLHVAKAFDLFEARLLYLAWTQDRCFYDKNADSTDLRRRFKKDSQNFGELADRLIQAYELFFDAEPSKVEISNSKGTIDEDRYYL